MERINIKTCDNTNNYNNNYTKVPITGSLTAKTTLTSTSLK